MKYIIDVPQEIAKISEEFLSKAGLLCEPYTEPDLNPLVDEAVETIENEVWDFASMLMNMHPDVAEDIYWSMNGGKGIGVAAEMSYQEAKTTYEAWKKRKDEQIHVGDEVISFDVKAVVMDTDTDGSIVVYTENACVERWGDCHRKIKTGRHFPEVAQLLEKMRGES